MPHVMPSESKIDQKTLHGGFFVKIEKLYNFPI